MLISNYYYSQYLPIHIYDLNCTGLESNLWDCPYDNITQSCGYSNDAAVVCQCE